MATLDEARWASNNVTLPGAGTDNKVEPTTALKDNGYDLSQKPTCQEENFWRNAVYEWIQELDGRTITGFQGAYPVGSIYLNASDSTNPATLFGFGTWTRISQGRVLMGEGTGTDSIGEGRTFNIGETGGEYRHILTVDEMPSHTHTDIGAELGDADGSPGGQGYSGSHSTGSTGGSQPHNNIQPYLTVYIWQRTA